MWAVRSLATRARRGRMLGEWPEEPMQTMQTMGKSYLGPDSSLIPLPSPYFLLDLQRTEI